MRHTKENLKNAVLYWQSAFRIIEEQSDNFATHPKGMSDERLLSQKFVSDWFLEFAPFMFNVWLPKYHAKLRRAIAYCYELQARQEAAYQREAERIQKQHQSLNDLLAQFPQMANAQRISATKKHFGWER